jgi:protein arginine N-methyltransferase 1
MYSLNEYGGMIADSVRRGPYTQAIEAAVRPGSVVVDLGSGPGFFALIACRAGARRVYAIDLSEVVHFGRRFATANSFTDRIEFLQGDSRQIQLPERADVIVSDIRGALPFSGHSLVSLEDARQRFLAEGGTLIPQRDTLFAAIVESEKIYDEIRSPWQSSDKGLDLSPALPCVLNDLHSTDITEEQLVTEPQSWWVIEYMKSPSLRAAATLDFRTTRGATAHGVAVWFVTQLFGKIGFSCAPGGPRTVYGHSFLPWLQPVTISAGQEIQVALHADLVGGDYIWRWETKIYEDGKGVIHHFQQSTLEGTRGGALASGSHGWKGDTRGDRIGGSRTFSESFQAAGRSVSACLGVGGEVLPLAGVADSSVGNVIFVFRLLTELSTCPPFPLAEMPG